MAKALALTQVGQFDVHGDSSSISMRWVDWLSSFEIFAIASGIESDTQKRALLLHCAGKDTQEIFKTLSDTGTTYAHALAKLNEYFQPKQNVSFQRHLFRREKQRPEETVTEFVVRLRKHASTCAFPEDEVENFIRDQVVDKCTSKKLREKLLSEANLTLKKTLELAQAREASMLQAQQMEDDDKTFSLKSLNKSLPPRQSEGRPRVSNSHRYSRAPPLPQSGGTLPQCGRCGRKGHRSSECLCTKGKTCFRCQGQGHFASMCKNSTKKHSSVRHLDTDTSQSDTESETYGTDEELIKALFCIDTTDHDTTNVKIEGTDISLLIDSGATCNVLNTKDANKLISKGIKLRSCDKTVHPYRSKPIKVSHYIKVNVEFNGAKTRTKFLVIPGRHVSLLGRKDAQILNILFIANSVQLNTPPTHSVSQPTLAPKQTSPLDKYPGIDKGIGKLTGQTVKVHVDKSVPPVARKHSRVPFHLRDKVEKEIKKLEEQDIIEKVTGPTEWVSRIVTPPKPKNPSEIRVCVDMREANKAVIRTRHVTPTIEELISDLNGATVFSKIDLRAGYHQLELEPESRPITTFSTHVGLFRYKRLVFGLNSAAEVFQHTIQQLIEGIPGARNVSDDIIVFGKDTAQHDKALDDTLKKLHGSGLTVNKEKCEFNKSEIEFFGFIFSASGLRPDPKKVQALHDMQKPQNASEVRSLIGMAQYSARFIDNFSTITEVTDKTGYTLDLDRCPRPSLQRAQGGALNQNNIGLL